MAKAPLAEMWEEAKKAFETATGKKKPKESKGIANAWGSFTGLSGSLEKFDKADAAAEKTDNRKESDLKTGGKLLEEMEKQLAAFVKAKDQYAKVLEKAIDEQIDERAEKDTKTTYERALKFMMKSLVAVVDTGESRVTAIRQRFNPEEKDLGVKSKMLLNWEKNMKGAVARAVAGVAKVKATPTVATYNSIFPTAARDVTMQLVFAKDIDGLLADPEPILRAMNPFASQAGNAPAQLPDNATEVHVKQFLDAFTQELKKAGQLVATMQRYQGR